MNEVVGDEWALALVADAPRLPNGRLWDDMNANEPVNLGRPSLRNIANVVKHLDDGGELPAGFYYLITGVFRLTAGDRVKVNPDGGGRITVPSLRYGKFSVQMWMLMDPIIRGETAGHHTIEVDTQQGEEWAIDLRVLLLRRPIPSHVDFEDLNLWNVRGEPISIGVSFVSEPGNLWEGEINLETDAFNALGFRRPDQHFSLSKWLSSFALSAAKGVLTHRYYRGLCEKVYGRRLIPFNPAVYAAAWRACTIGGKEVELNKVIANLHNTNVARFDDNSQINAVRLAVSTWNNSLGLSPGTSQILTNFGQPRRLVSLSACYMYTLPCFALFVLSVRAYLSLGRGLKSSSGSATRSLTFRLVPMSRLASSILAVGTSITTSIHSSGEWMRVALSTRILDQGRQQ